LLRRERCGGVGRRHSLRLIRFTDAFEQAALFGIPRHDDGFRVGAAIRDVETEIRHAIFLVGSVAGETVVGEDRANLTIEVDGAGWALSGEQTGSRGKERNQSSDLEHPALLYRVKRLLSVHSLLYDPRCET
jgi:hypothetical protein